MAYIATTFAHGNGPYSRTLEWAIELNNIRQERKLKRLSIVVPLVYGERQKKILRELIESRTPGFLAHYPEEIIFDRVQGALLDSLMFKSSDYSENLNFLIKNYSLTERKFQKHINGKRTLETFSQESIGLDLRDAELQLGLNNRMQSGLKYQFYTSGGAGPFDEILERAIPDSRIRLSGKLMKKALPIARRMIENQRVIFSNIPGVFSYDPDRVERGNEILTPPFVHPPAQDTTPLPGKGIYIIATGIDRISQSGIYDASADLGLGLYVSEATGANLQENLRRKVVAFLTPDKINNPNIVAQYGRAGWSTVWLSHLAEKAFLTPKYNERDDPEISFNQRAIQLLGLGVIVDKNPEKSLEYALELSRNVHSFNLSLQRTFGTLDGIRYAAERVADYMGYGKN